MTGPNLESVHQARARSIVERSKTLSLFPNRDVVLARVELLAATIASQVNPRLRPFNLVQQRELLDNPPVSDLLSQIQEDLLPSLEDIGKSNQTLMNA